MVDEDKAGKTLVGGGALAYVLAQTGSVTGPLVSETVISGAFVLGAFAALRNSDDK